ncbi:MAG: hypothetical protein E3J87_11150 [Candidatus Cloacimonadota bacterium]|nr:MAG: hypothetical protein E3J87_11150 [Candidatus Cloacimonadota bacterium]
METAFYFIVNFLSYIIPVRLAHFLAKWIIVALYSTFYRKQRINVEKNLTYVFKSRLRGWEKKRLVLDTFLNFASFFYEFLIIKRINQKNFRNFLNPIGFEKVGKALKKEKGVIFITGHLGNWEWGASTLTYLGYPPIVIANRFRNRFITKYFFDRRQQQGMEVVYLEDAVRKSLRKLRRNGLVAIVGDRNFTNQGVEVPFFGKETKFPTGAFLLGIRCGAPVIPTFAVRVGMCKYDVIFENPIYFEGKSYKEEEVKKYLMKWVKTLEGYIRRYPNQWYRFEPFWVTEEK